MFVLVLGNLFLFDKLFYGIFYKYKVIFDNLFFYFERNFLNN